MKLVQVLLSAYLSTIALCGRQNFENYKVYKVTLKTQDHIRALLPLETKSGDVLVLNRLHLGETRFVISPGYDKTFKYLLRELKLSPKLIDVNAQASLSLDIEPVADSNRRSDDYTFTEYHELNDTHHWMRNLVEKYSGEVTLFLGGKSYEGRELLGLRIDRKDGRAEKHSIFLEAGMHAREWIGPATAAYFANELLSSQNPEIISLCKSYVWYILPHANPDGFVYTHTTNRLWRKTRSPQEKNCIGTDPNRNWDFHWREVGASNESCSDSYAGPRAFSEPETESLSKYLSAIPEPMFMYISLHSFSQLLLYPYGHTPKLPENNHQLKTIVNSTVAAIKRRYGTRYRGGNVHSSIYPAAGSSMDWAYGVMNVKYSFTYELRPSGNSFWTGFRLPASQIIPTGQETTDALVEMIKTAAKIDGYILQ